MSHSPNPTRLIQPGTNDVTVAEHTPVTIACMVSSFPEPSYEWTFENEVMTSKLKYCCEFRDSKMG